MKLKIFILFIFLTKVTSSNSQHQNPHTYLNNVVDNTFLALTNDDSYDVKHYHLDVEISIDTEYIKGSVSYIFTSNIDDLSGIRMDLDDAFTIDSMSSTISEFSFENKIITINFLENYQEGEEFSFIIYYQGIPDLAGGYKGLRYETHDNGEPIIATLSTPYLAHSWWPCKDGVSDKADSTFIDITIKDTIINDLPLIAVSNGLLKNVETNGNKKTFEWKHRYPIVPYYVMVAISNYTHFQQIYEAEDYNFPIDYYVFQSHLASAQNGVKDIPTVMAFFENIFGPYPFRNEKYGMTQLGYYGGIENQTNTIINNMSQDWLYISVHELAHMWFADMITCKTWNHGWLNEGFASYSEALYEEHITDFESYQNYIKDWEFYDEGSLYLEDVSDPFSVFQGILYNKGPYVLHMLRGVLGDDMFFSVLKSYSTNSSFNYQHASTEDFQSIAEELSGLDLDYFFDQWIYDERYPVYHYNYTQNEKKVSIQIDQTQAELGWRDVFIMPIQLKINYTDGSNSVETVFNNLASQSFTFETEKEVQNVELDPEHWILKESIYDPTIVVNTTIQTPKIESYFIFPNPTEEYFNIKSTITKNTSDVHISIMDIHGKTIFSKNTLNGSLLSDKIDTNNLSSGLYFVVIRSNQQSVVKKLVIK